MKIQPFVDMLRSGHLALGSKLSSLLTEDCTILEYTNESVLFSKGSKLILAKFKNPLTESKMTSVNILDNEIIEISKSDLTTSMKSTLNKVVEHIISENLVDAQECLDEFCQSFYQMSILKNRYPEIFVEELVKNSKGREIRNEAKKLVPAFKAELFNIAVLSEDSEEIESTKLMALTESNLGKVLALGKLKVKQIVTDALLGNETLAESVTNNLYTIIEWSMEDGSNRENKYDVGAGKFDDEDQSDLDREDEEIPSVPTEKKSLLDKDDDESKEFTPFNPAMFSEEDIKQLHKTTLKSILLSMQDFVHDKASDSADEQVDPDLADQINADLLALDDDELGDDRLSEIEARWNPMISYFLDSDYHTPADELADMEEQPLENQLPPENPEEVTSVDNVEAGSANAGVPAAPIPGSAIAQAQPATQPMV